MEQMLKDEAPTQGNPIKVYNISMCMGDLQYPVLKAGRMTWLYQVLARTQQDIVCIQGLQAYTDNHKRHWSVRGIAMKLEEASSGLVQIYHHTASENGPFMAIVYSPRRFMLIRAVTRWTGDTIDAPSGIDEQCIGIGQAEFLMRDGAEVLQNGSLKKPMQFSIFTYEAPQALDKLKDFASVLSRMAKAYNYPALMTGTLSCKGCQEATDAINALSEHLAHVTVDFKSTVNNPPRQGPHKRTCAMFMHNWHWVNQDSLAANEFLPFNGDLSETELNRNRSQHKILQCQFSLFRE